MGTASWKEPGAWEWVEANGFAHGFGPPVNAPHLAQRLPNGTKLVYAFRTVEFDSADVMFGVGGTRGNFHVEPRPGEDPPSGETLRKVWESSMDLVYTGEAASRDAARGMFHRDEWLLKAGGAMFFSIQNSWSFERVLPANASFEPGNENSSYALTAGEWRLLAAPTPWRRHFETVSQPHLSLLTIDRSGRTEVEFWYVAEEHEAKALVQRAVEPFAWTFQDRDFETECPRV